MGAQALTPEQLLIVNKVFADTGILTVRDKDTYPDSKAPPYGMTYAPTRQHLTTDRYVRDEMFRHKREIQTWHTDAARFPDGVPVGMTEVWQPKGLAELGGDPTLKRIGGKADICMGEQKRLRSYVHGRRWMTDAERKADEVRKEDLRQRRNISDLDPASATGRAIAKHLGDALKAAGLVARADTLSVKRRIVPVPDLGPNVKKRRFFVEEADGSQAAGPFETEDEADAALAEFESG